VEVYDGADGFTSLIKFCGRVCHFSRHRRLVWPRFELRSPVGSTNCKEEKLTSRAVPQAAHRNGDPFFLLFYTRSIRTCLMDFKVLRKKKINKGKGNM